MKTCIVCGTGFTPKANNAKMCSRECKIKRQMAQNSIFRQKKREQLAQKKRAEAEKAQNKPLTIAQTLDLARKAGVSYGKYVSQQETTL